jgi:transposase
MLKNNKDDPIGESLTVLMEETNLYTARVQVVEAMEQGLSWHEAVKRTGLHISQSTAYRLRQRMRRGGGSRHCRKAGMDTR